jgi:hypothetical protein
MVVGNTFGNSFPLNSEVTIDQSPLLVDVDPEF